jgi:predicted lipoprotein with Yx(FWY)xxD motif
VVSQKRTFIAAAGALVAALVLTGCGSDDVNLSSSQAAAVGAAPAIAADKLTATEPSEEPIQEPDPGDEVAAPDTEEEAEAEPAEPAVAAKPEGKVSNKLVAKTVPKMGNVVTDAKGWVLYRFDKDKASPSKSNCVGDCAKLWPPLLADDTLELSGLSAAKVDTIERADGGLQVTIGGWPVYRYIGDLKPGTWKGQNVGGVWFVVQKDGKKNLTCLPPVSKPVPLPADPAEGTAEGTAKTSAKGTAKKKTAKESQAADIAADIGGY